VRFGGSGWKPGSRRDRRRGGRPDPSTERGADRVFIVILVLFAVAALGLVLVLGVLTT
jgi:hypothetical protein